MVARPFPVTRVKSREAVPGPDSPLHAGIGGRIDRGNPVDEASRETGGPARCGPLKPLERPRSGGVRRVAESPAGSGCYVEAELPERTYLSVRRVVESCSGG